MVILIFPLFPKKIISITPQILAPVQLNIEDIKLIIIEAAFRYEIDAQEFLAVAKCESSFREKAVGDGGNSMGIFQIHLPSHPNVTEAEAFDPHFSSEWSAEKFKKNPRIWTCYRHLYE